MFSPACPARLPRTKRDSSLHCACERSDVRWQDARVAGGVKSPWPGGAGVEMSQSLQVPVTAVREYRHRQIKDGDMARFRQTPLANKVTYACRARGHRRSTYCGPSIEAESLRHDGSRPRSTCALLIARLELLPSRSLMGLRHPLPNCVPVRTRSVPHVLQSRPSLHGDSEGI